MELASGDADFSTETELAAVVARAFGGGRNFADSVQVLDLKQF